jgi:hypothetical protein
MIPGEEVRHQCWETELHHGSGQSYPVMRFPVRKYKKRLSGQGKKLSKEMFYRLVDFFNVYPPTDCLQRHHCHVITTYQNQRERTKFIHVLKV